jgi:predicted ATPase
MITQVRIRNYRSFVDAEVKLRPFSLVVGANGSGKSNLLKFFYAVSGSISHQLNHRSGEVEGWIFKSTWQKHINLFSSPSLASIETTDQGSIQTKGDIDGMPLFDQRPNWADMPVEIFDIASSAVSGIETILSEASVKKDGSGTAQVLESLKNGDREDLFDKIEESFKRYVPEVEKLSLRTVEEGKKQIQVREKGLKELLPATELSEGTRLILCILTIIHQENPPPIILLEDIDRGLHPRLFEYMAPLMKDIAESHNINILATTHNPYLVDCFQDDKEAVIIVEKKDGASTLSTLADRLEGLDYDSVDPDDLPLGNLWFSGLVGGVPAKINRRPSA